MAHFVEDMKCLREEIEKGRAARDEMMHDLQHFTKSTHNNVISMLGSFSKSRAKMAKKMAGEREKLVSDLKESVSNLKQSVSKFRNDFAKEVQEARRGWFNGHESSSTRHTKKKK